jgi:hypothetical protein
MGSCQLIFSFVVSVFGRTESFSQTLSVHVTYDFFESCCDFVFKFNTLVHFDINNTCFFIKLGTIFSHGTRRSWISYLFSYHQAHTFLFSRVLRLTTLQQTFFHETFWNNLSHCVTAAACLHWLCISDTCLSRLACGLNEFVNEIYDHLQPTAWYTSAPSRFGWMEEWMNELMTAGTVQEGHWGHCVIEQLFYWSSFFFLFRQQLRESSPIARTRGECGRKRRKSVDFEKATV